MGIRWMEVVWSDCRISRNDSSSLSRCSKNKTCWPKGREKADGTEEHRLRPNPVLSAAQMIHSPCPLMENSAQMKWDKRVHHELTRLTFLLVVELKNKWSSILEKYSLAHLQYFEIYNWTMFIDMEWCLYIITWKTSHYKTQYVLSCYIVFTCVCTSEMS